MKRLVASLLVCLMLVTSMALMSCGCEHTWDEGVITTKATDKADGVKTFTCTSCQETRTEAVAFTGLSEEDWNAALALASFENFAYTEVASTEGSGVSMNTESCYKFTSDNAWVKMTVAGQTQEQYAPSETAANEFRKQMVESIQAMTPYDSFTYDAATKTYKANKDITIATLDASTSDVTLTFDGNHLVKIEYAISFTQNSIAFTATATVTLSDYGTVVLTPDAE